MQLIREPTRPFRWWRYWRLNDAIDRLDDRLIAWRWFVHLLRWYRWYGCRHRSDEGLGSQLSTITNYWNSAECCVFSEIIRMKSRRKTRGLSTQHKPLVVKNTVGASLDPSYSAALNIHTHTHTHIHLRTNTYSPQHSSHSKRSPQSWFAFRLDFNAAVRQTLRVNMCVCNRWLLFTLVLSMCAWFVQVRARAKEKFSLNYFSFLHLWFHLDAKNFITLANFALSTSTTDR